MLFFVKKNSRQLLNTPRNVKTKKMEPGLYVHFGLKSGIKEKLSSTQVNDCIQNGISLAFNIDGLPIFKSLYSAWPILGCIVLDGKVFIVGMYYGIGKPESSELLKEFVEELNDICSNGI